MPGKMEVVVVTQSDPFYLPFFFEKFFRLVENDERLELKTVWLVPTFDESKLQTTMRIAKFYGPFNFCLLLTRYTKIKLKSYLGFSSKLIRKQMRRSGIDHTEIENVNSAESINKLREIDPDVLLSVAASQKFDQEVINIPRWGTLNVHSSHLPHNRGMMPVFWQMKQGAKEIGITLHTMTEELDRGKIVKQGSIEVREGQSLDYHIREAKKKAAEVVLQGLREIASGKEQLEPMVGDGSYHSFPTRQDAKELEKRGFSLL